MVPQAEVVPPFRYGAHAVFGKAFVKCPRKFFMDSVLAGRFDAPKYSVVDNC
jgi:hypothetical protein